MKKLILLILILSFGCKSKQITNNTLQEYKQRIDSLERIKSRVKTDTFTKFKDRIITNQVQTLVEVPIECDSLGIIKNLKLSTGSGAARATVEIKNNQLSVTTKIDSMIVELEKVYRSKYISDSTKLHTKLLRDFESKQVDITEITKFRMPLWAYIVFSALLVGAIYYLQRKFKIFNYL